MTRAEDTGRDLTPKEVEEVLAEIAAMTDQVKMACIYRFAKSGSRFFRPDTSKAFMARFEELGGMTPRISKLIGW